jgi:hypothetical protein
VASGHGHVRDHDAERLHHRVAHRGHRDIAKPQA